MSERLFAPVAGRSYLTNLLFMAAASKPCSRNRSASVRAVGSSSRLNNTAGSSMPVFNSLAEYIARSPVRNISGPSAGNASDSRRRSSASIRAASSASVRSTSRQSSLAWCARLDTSTPHERHRGTSCGRFTPQAEHWTIAIRSAPPGTERRIASSPEAGRSAGEKASRSAMERSTDSPAPVGAKPRLSSRCPASRASVSARDQGRRPVSISYSTTPSE